MQISKINNLFILDNIMQQLLMLILYSIVTISNFALLYTLQITLSIMQLLHKKRLFIIKAIERITYFM